MPFNDFDVFWRAAQALLQGHDPYAVHGVYYPLPMFFLFLPLAALPLDVAHAIWTGIEGLILVAILRKRAVSVVLFMPVVLSFLMGQIVMPMLGLYRLLKSGVFGGITLALMCLKPQLVAFIVPWMLWRWWQNDRKQIAWFAAIFTALALASFAAQPDWVARWLAVSGERLRAPISPSVWGLFSFLPNNWWVLVAGLVTVMTLLWAWRQQDLDSVMVASMLVNPVLISYDFTLFTVMLKESRTWLILTVLSWAAFGISAMELNERIYLAITLAVLFLLHKQRGLRLKPTLLETAARQGMETG